MKNLTEILPQDEENETLMCPTCNGAGIERQNKLLGGTIDIPCTWCNGTGRVKSKDVYRDLGNGLLFFHRDAQNVFSFEKSLSSYMKEHPRIRIVSISCDLKNYESSAHVYVYGHIVITEPRSK